ncbi:MAG: 16S rRNA (cytosine(1402)-N(4))-methyltransferase RsmH [Verrucomicrobia bacterium]|nr:16S rRNA (cytosine(1402)-N(4))-methyltransferase RsmH [Verrucomicrobiota bacterium]
MSEISPIPSAPRPPRRKRYAGQNPRRFEEKYKEHNPEKYADDVAKVIASGKTPAGTHRPIMVAEILAALAPKPGEVAVDCTLGYGGHAAELLRALAPGGRLIGLDADPIELPKTEARLRELGFGPEVFQMRRTNFAGLQQVLTAEELAGVDLVLADLGLSSMQMDNPARGFTYKFGGPLDLRMNPERGQPAAALLAKLGEEKLRELLVENSDEPHAALLAHAIAESKSRRPIPTTTELAAIIRVALKTLPKQVREQEGDAPVRRVFQALRIAVNDEFGVLDALLRNLPVCLNAGGRVAILTFHSGEDRRVKKAFQAGRLGGIYSVISEEVTRASAEELHANPRASSAKLRWAVKA